MLSRRKVDRKVVLDTETTGLSAEKGDRVLEIGCVEIINSFITDNYFHCYINPERDVPEASSKIHGLTLQRLKNEPVFTDIADKFLEFIQDSPLIIHNAKFDIAFLNAELQKSKRSLLNFKNVIDTLEIARVKFPGSPASLDALCKRFSISLEDRKYHGALLDAKLLSKVYLELNYLEQMELFNEYVASNADDLDEEKRMKINIPARNYKISDEELQMHRKFLHKIKNPLWAQNS